MIALLALAGNGCGPLPPVAGPCESFRRTDHLAALAQEGCAFGYHQAEGSAATAHALLNEERQAATWRDGFFHGRARGRMEARQRSGSRLTIAGAILSVLGAVATTATVATLIPVALGGGDCCLLSTFVTFPIAALLPALAVPLLSVGIHRERAAEWEMFQLDPPIPPRDQNIK